MQKRISSKSTRSSIHKGTEVRYNSEWLGKLSSYEVIQLCGKYRLARMLEHEDFRSRLANNQPIAVHELLYSLFQGYDSVALKADVELGATEQKFNLLVGREVQREYGQPSQVVFTMPILVGLDGQRKMSKSLGNYVGITEAPSQMFGKLMSISDEMMWAYMDLLTDRTPAQIAQLRAQVESGAAHPKATKVALAVEIIAGFTAPKPRRTLPTSSTLSTVTPTPLTNANVRFQRGRRCKALEAH